MQIHSQLPPFDGLKGLVFALAADLGLNDVPAATAAIMDEYAQEIHRAKEGQTGGSPEDHEKYGNALLAARFKRDEALVAAIDAARQAAGFC